MCEGKKKQQNKKKEIRVVAIVVRNLKVDVQTKELEMNPPILINRKNVRVVFSYKESDAYGAIAIE